MAGGRWLDVFVTKPETGIGHQSYDFDDQFVCSVQSVRIDPSSLVPSSSTVRAIVTNDSSDWIMPTWTTQYDAAGHPSQAAFDDVQVGDLIRIGVTSSHGYTDYVTIVEKLAVDVLYNGTGVEISTDYEGTDDSGVITYDTISNNTGESPTPVSRGSKTLNKLGFAHYALRLNMSLNATALPVLGGGDDSTGIKTDTTLTDASPTAATLATRHAVSLPRKYVTREDEKYYYPMYKTNKWLAGTTLRAALDHGVKQVSEIRLVGYSVMNKRQIGLHHSHEVTADDYVIMRINEIEGHVISNNRFANGAFAVLYVGSTSDNQVGAIEYSRFDPDGLVTQQLDATNSVLRNLTFELTDRTGKAAHFGRLHLWLKLRVTHG